MSIKCNIEKRNSLRVDGVDVVIQGAKLLKRNGGGWNLKYYPDIKKDKEVLPSIVFNLKPIIENVDIDKNLLVQAYEHLKKIDIISDVEDIFDTPEEVIEDEDKKDK